MRSQSRSSTASRKNMYHLAEVDRMSSPRFTTLPGRLTSDPSSRALATSDQHSLLISHYGDSSMKWERPRSFEGKWGWVLIALVLCCLQYVIAALLIAVGLVPAGITLVSGILFLVRNSRGRPFSLFYFNFLAPEIAHHSHHYL